MVPLFYQGKDLSQTYDHCKKLAELVGLGDRLDHARNNFPAASSNASPSRVPWSTIR